MYPDIDKLKKIADESRAAATLLRLSDSQRAVVMKALKDQEKYWAAKYGECVDRT